MKYVLATTVGLFIGSFYVSAATRVLYYFYGPGRKNPDRWKDFFLRPSFCFSCEKPILRRNLIPILSFVLLAGRCRSCGTKISPLAPTGELLCGFIPPLLLATGASWPAAFFAVLLCGQLFIAIATDHQLYLLDHENTMFLFLWAFAGAFTLSGPSAFSHHVWTAAATAALFLLLYSAGLFFRNNPGLGWGDVLLAPTLALYIGFPWCLLLFEIAAAATIFYIFFILKKRDAPAPFGVFLAGGFYLTLIARNLYSIFFAV